MAYATVGQYVSRYGAVSDENMLQECLDDASAVINAALDRVGIDYSDPSDEFQDRLMRVCRSMANRVMPTENDIPQGVTSMSMGAVGFSESYSFATTYGTPKLLDSEMSLLGIKRGKYRSIMAHTWADDCNA